MNQPLRVSPLSFVSCLVSSLGISSLLLAPVSAQVNGPGPSPASAFDTVLNLPGDEAQIIDPPGFSSGAIGGVPGETIQLNISDGGAVGQGFDVDGGVELNISGGMVGDSLGILAGNEVNISGGTIDRFVDVTGSVVNISGGTVVGGLNAVDSMVNISGGDIGFSLDAGPGTVVNFSGGSLGVGLNAEQGGIINISGGTLGNQLTAESGGVVNISGGSVGNGLGLGFGPFGDVIGFNAQPGSEVNISGGTIGTDFNASVGSNVEIIGSDFRLNGEFVFLLDRVTVGPSDVFTGVLADGSSFIFGGFASDELNDVRLDFSTVPAADLNPIVINTPVVDGPSGLRRGQTLTLEAGGSLDFVDNYAVVEATLNVEGGVLGDSVETHNSLVNVSGGVVGDLFDAGPGTEVNLSGGTVGSGFDAFEGSEVNITGGTFGVDFDAGPGSTVNISGGIMGFNFDAFPNSQVNIFGRGILIEGEPLEGLVLGQPFTITDRNVTLSGLLADGEPFTLELNSSNETFDVDDFGLGIIFDGDDYFDPDATLTVTLVSPDPNVVLGDCDLNGVANFSDIAPFIAILASNTFLLEADCNLDGVVNFMDIASFIEILSGQ